MQSRVQSIILVKNRSRFCHLSAGTVNLMDSKMLKLTRLVKVKTTLELKGESWEVFRDDEHKALLKESISLSSTNKKATSLMNLGL